MYPPDLDPETLRLKRTARVKTRRSKRGVLPRPEKGEAYLAGPIPMSWIEQAAVLPGKAWHLASALWFVAIRSRDKSPCVVVTQKTRQRFGLTRPAYYRAQETLEKARLVRIDRCAGRKTEFTILPVEAGKPKQKRRKLR